MTPSTNRRECRAIAGLFCSAVLFFAAPVRAQDVPPFPVWAKTDSGFLGLFGKGSEYSRFQVTGPSIQIQDPAHLLLRPGMGLLVTFAEKKNFPGPDMLVAHAHWEEDYWRAHASKVDTATRADLAGGRSDVRVTELTLHNPSGATLGIDLVGFKSTDGVFAFAFSPAGDSTTAEVRGFVHSLALVHKALTREELMRLSDSLKLRRPPER